MTGADWGPSHQEETSHSTAAKWFWRAVLVMTLLCSPLGRLPVIVWIAVLVAWCCRWRLIDRFAPASSAGPAVSDPYSTVRAQGAAHRAGVYLGLDRRRAWRFSACERAVLLLGPPRSGKTSAVIVPAVLSHHGPVVSTSTKPDVLASCQPVRSSVGTVWQFDPAGVCEDLPGVRRLHWSPLVASMSWDGALLMARALVTGTAVGTGTTDANHWVRRAQALLAPLLHAAAIEDKGMGQVLEWVSAHECDQPGAMLEAAGDESRLAVSSLLGVANCEQRERASIFSAAADALEAYTSTGALQAAADPNFDATGFVRSEDSLFIHAPADRQQLVAPLVCGLLGEIRRATYDAHAGRGLPAHVLFALDEVANIAPVSELPAIASEGGGQGLLLLAALQDLSQARVRWGAAADGFLTLFGTKLILPGVADQRTLEAVSVMLGEYDRQVVSRSNPESWLLRSSAKPSRTVSTQRTRVLSPGEVANLPAGHGLHLTGVAWELLELTPAHELQPWKAPIGEGSR